MSREELEERRDHALRDLEEIERQHAEGELTDADVARLRPRYEAEAAAAIRELDAPERGLSPAAARVGGRAVRARRAAYLVTLAAAVIAATVLLPQSVLDRPAGGFVTGNELDGNQPDAAAEPVPGGRDLSTVTNSEMEAVVQANPDVVGMRLALARRYVEVGDLPSAMLHFTEALKREPDNPEALAYVGWAYLLAEQPDKAEDYITQARRLDPTLLDALWFDANLRLHWLDDPGGALEVLAEMAERPDLPPDVADQVEELAAAARAQLDAAGGDGG
ncbi:tetratricopeptide repeat protein [Blastococcus sp. MG754426]|uniref:tetratricopeptide repeat protein n=1 Tax=unclassified Blastococcus TaxID=2619396 RepID=UPI000DE9EFEE|nr:MULTISPECIES: tetratricopeptide repeat protein [unclassified Blastococcus]MCF6507803.1 tetratricopeptide repeat protein [Blastococcus sp. MG754426]MCF6510190.1 tetratricopeptide repeat protein [Blastococcus sp. MG754427]MCF6736155.1 tetratricopeptide repeat protein [Blastococcus sp. KM273129]RBY92479.1 cytochrome C biosynthesis protein [Blastococcus sp. TF02-8]